jgi:hypothetical protein
MAKIKITSEAFEYTDEKGVVSKGFMTTSDRGIDPIFYPLGDVFDDVAEKDPRRLRDLLTIKHYGYGVIVNEEEKPQADKSQFRKADK